MTVLRWKCYFIFSLLIVVSITSVASTKVSAEKKLRILTIEVPPVAFFKSGYLTGYCVEVARDIQRRIGDRTEIEVLPWARAFHMGQNLPNIVLLCPKRTPERERMFKWVGPVLKSSTVLYKKRGSSIKIGSLEDAKKVSGILVPRNFYFIPDLVKKGFVNLTEVNTTTVAVTMLLKGRQPLVLMEEKQVAGLLKDLRQDPKAIEAVLTLAPAISYFAFSKEISDEEISKWQHTLEQMKSDGTVAKIHDKWF